MFKSLGQAIRTTLKGNMRVTDTGYLNDVRHGNIENHEFVQIRGHSHAIGATDQEMSALGTAGFGNWPVAAAGVIIVSDDAEDVVAGDGARSVIIRGLDDNWEPVTVTIVPLGATPTTVTSQTFFRIDEMEVGIAGSDLTNAGNITASISGANIMRIYPNHSTSDAGRMTVPAGKSLYLENPEASGIGNKEITYHIFCRDNTVTNSPFLLRMSWHSKDGGYRPNGKLAIATEKTDIILVAHADTGAAGSASIEGWTEVI